MDQRMRFQKKLIKGVIIFLGVILAFTIISSNIYEYLLPVVVAEKVKASSIQITNNEQGIIEVNRQQLKEKQVKLKTPKSGQVMAVEAELGTYIEAGTVLFKIEAEESQEAERNELEKRLDQESLEAQVAYKETLITGKKEKLKEKSLELKQEEATYEMMALADEIENLKETVALDEALLKEGALSEQAYKEDQLKLNQLSLSLAQKKQDHQEALETELEALEESLNTLEEEQLELKRQLKQASLTQTIDNETIVTSPVSGYVYELNVKEGEAVAKGSLLATIVPEGIPCELHFEVDDFLAERIKQNQEVTWLLNDKLQKASVTRKETNPQNGEKVIYCKLGEEALEKLDLDYRGTKEVRVKLVEKTEAYETVVPKSAIIEAEGNKYVYVLLAEEGLFETTYKVQSVQVTLLKEGDTYVAVEGNLTKGKKVVKTYSKALKDQAEVSLKLGGNDE